VPTDRGAGDRPTGRTGGQALSLRDLPQLPGDLPPAVAATALTGGDVADTWRVTLSDDRDVVVKTGSTDARLEAEGLDALRTAGGTVPVVLAVDRDVLVLEHVAGRGDPRTFGRMLADVHATTATDFGWHRDNVIGPLPQRNDHSTDWPTFLASQRLAPHLGVLPPDLARRLRSAIDDGRLAGELDHDPAPSLVHGDLWSGNVLGWRWLIDPAVHYADREVDLAMLELFGDLPPAFLDGYTEVAPLPAGVARRRLVLQLVPLLVHVRLFGASYLGGIEQRMRRLGW
jgi:fructosamine-3-kinase